MATIVKKKYNRHISNAFGREPFSNLTFNREFNLNIAQLHEIKKVPQIEITLINERNKNFELFTINYKSNPELNIEFKNEI